MTQTVYQLIASVSAEIAQDGISKSRKNQQQGYSFRGIDDVYNALAPVMARHGLVILPRILSRELTERSSSKGGVLFSVVVEAEFDFVSSHDGSKHTVKTYGEAMDSADKATNKAMSAAYKYAAFQTFCIPTEGDNDADAVTHVIQRAHVVDMEAYEAEHLPGLREAALAGQETLAAAFGKIAKSPEKAAFWQKHGASLKSAAQKESE
jgi:hypothetical protein